MTTSINCRLCGSFKTTPAFSSLNSHGRQLQSSETFVQYYCYHCSAFFLPPLKHQKIYYSRYYQKNYYPKNTFIIQILNFVSFSFKKILIKKLLPPHQSTTILDVGCGQGLFLESLPNEFKKYGIEINTKACKTNLNKDINILNSDINHAQFGKTKFDCITMWHVLEHLPCPSLTLKKINRLLKPNGVLIITTPNSQCLGFKYGRKDYFHLDSPRHLFIPSQKSLSFLLTKAKFSSFKFQYPFYDYPLDLFWSLGQSPMRFIVYPLYPIFKLLSPETVLTVAIK